MAEARADRGLRPVKISAGILFLGVRDAREKGKSDERGERAWPKGEGHRRTFIVWKQPDERLSQVSF
jgi:hypothetical protein